MRRIDALRTLAMSSALVLALAGSGCAGEEDTSDPSEPPDVEAAPAEEAPDEAAGETSPPAEKPDTEASEADEEESDTESSEAKEE